MSLFNKDEENEQEYTSILGDAQENTESQDISEEGQYYVDNEEDNEDEIGLSEEEEINLPYDDMTEQTAPPAPKKKKTVPAWMIPVVAVIMVVLLVGGYFGVTYLPNAFKMMKISKMEKDGHYYTAMQEYMVLYEKDDSDKKVALKLSNVMMKMGYFSDASTILSTAYDEEELSNAKGDLKESYDVIQKMMATTEFVNGIYSNLSQDSTAQAAIEQLEAAKGQEYLDEFLTYYQYVFAAMFGEDMDTQQQYVKQACDYDSDISYIFYPTYSSFRRYNRDYDGAIEVCNKALEYNKDDFSSYGELAYIYLLKEDNAKALEYASKSYAIAPDQANTTNVMLLAYAAAGMDAEYDTLLAQAETKGITVDEAVTGFKEGTYTLGQILLGESANGTTDGAGDTDEAGEPAGEPETQAPEETTVAETEPAAE